MSRRWKYYCLPTCLLACLILGSLTGSARADDSGFSHKPIAWQELMPGLEFARVESLKYTRLGDPHIGLVRLDPEKVAFKVFHMRDTPNKRPMNITAWRARTKALIAFNTGQYDDKGTHLGLLVRDGQNIGARIHRSYKGIFAAEPSLKEGSGADRAEPPKAVLIDLDEQAYDLKTSPYTEVVQSFMLLDAKGKKRVRESDWKANRTIMAIDRAGRIIVLCTEGGYTLWEMASWLAESELEIVRAMSLDGGYRAEMAVKVDDFEYTTFGQWESNDLGSLSLPGFRATLPAIVGVFPR